MIQKKIIPSIILISTLQNSSFNIKLKTITSDKICQNIYSISNIGIYISNDYGVNWNISDVSTTAFWTAISCDYSGQNIVAACLESSNIFGIIMYNSIDNGVTWNNIMTIYNKCNTITSNYNGQYLFVNSLVFDGGVYISSDYGMTWIKELILDNCNSITSNKSGKYLAVTSNSAKNGGIYTSNDYGKTWTNRIFFSNTWINIASDDSGQYLAATSFSNNSGDINTKKNIFQIYIIYIYIYVHVYVCIYNFQFP